MAFTKIQNRRKVESILVADGNAALATAGTNLNGTAGVVNLTDGQLGVFSASSDGTVTINTALAAGDTAIDAPVIQIYQGTSNSATPVNADNYPTASRPYEASEKIYASGVISYKGQSFSYPSQTVVCIGSTTAANAIDATDETEYKVNIAYRGRRQDEFQSSTHGVPVFPVSYTTPDYTALGTTNPEDHLIINLADQINKNSRAFYQMATNFGGQEPVIALALDLGGGTGTALSSVDDPASPGSAFTVFTDANGVARTYTPTAAFARAIQLAIAASGELSTATTIEPYVVSTAGAVTNCDALLIVTLDERTAAGEDRNEFLKVRIDVGLAGGFSTAVKNEVAARSDEGQGSGRQWKIYFKDTSGQRKYSQNRWFYPVLNYPAVNDIDDNGQYDAYIIEHYDAKHMGMDRTDVNAKKTIILVDPADTTTTPSLEAVLNGWFGSLGFTDVNL